jgi:hypothetical protein
MSSLTLQNTKIPLKGNNNNNSVKKKLTDPQPCHGLGFLFLFCLFFCLLCISGYFCHFETFTSIFAFFFRAKKGHGNP